MKIAFLGLLLAGCVTSPGVGNMTPEQLQSLSSVRACTAVCSQVQGPVGGSSKFVFISCDQTQAHSSLVMDKDCVASMSTNAK